MTAWLKIRSWHMIDPATHNGAKTYCGLLVTKGTDWRDKPPEDEKTCERCFQLREARK